MSSFLRAYNNDTVVADCQIHGYYYVKHGGCLLCPQCFPQNDFDQETAAAIRSHILENLFPETQALFAAKSKDYSATFLKLGMKGQFSDINRKFQKLHKAFWLEQPLGGEQPREILMDMVGHCMLTMALLDREEAHGRLQDVCEDRDGAPE